MEQMFCYACSRQVGAYDQGGLMCHIFLCRGGESSVEGTMYEFVLE